MKQILMSFSALAAGIAMASPYTGNDAASNAMGTTGVASASATSATNFNPAMLAENQDTNFELSLFTTKVYTDDSAGLVETLDDIQNVMSDADFDAFNTAIAGDGTEASMSTVISDVTDNTTAITTLVTRIQSDAQSGSVDPSDITALNNESASLTTNTTLLDSKVSVTDTEVTNLQNIVDSSATVDGLPFQVGVGENWLDAALPNNNLSMAVSVSTNLVIGAQVLLSDGDQTTLDALLQDLDGMTDEASVLSAEMVKLAAANEALTAHINEQPDENDYAGGAASQAYQDDLAEWADELATLSDNVETQAAEVETATTAVSSYNGTYFTNGEFDDSALENFDSEIEFIGAQTTELAVAFAKNVIIADTDVALGVTPKLQMFTVFEKRIELDLISDESDEISDDPVGYFQENSTTLLRGNLDLGAAKSWDYKGKLTTGLALKDVIPWDLETDQGSTLKIRPKLRAGLAHSTTFSTLAMDLDLTENQALKYGVPTRYLALGGELKAGKHAALRAGYRNNLAVDSSHVVSTGFGLTPFGVGLEFSTWVQPDGFSEATEFVKDFGFALQASASF
ncbi:conjugal transfer protein TraF [Reinekea thalattae]|uniref:Conjugal transfer protein TraF n=1 Tax=Reinekea thalattae TaxID=2593301 RepID=A0A5C8Z4I2_9GAMM|nr:conjugal transfer protein TraF [Reinekea thalattae]TXR51826.1 hypothetical protein FME95_10360 [Reinekea thalattae]